MHAQTTPDSRELVSRSWWGGGGRDARANNSRLPRTRTPENSSLEVSTLENSPLEVGGGGGGGEMHAQTTPDSRELVSRSLWRGGGRSLQLPTPENSSLEVFGGACVQPVRGRIGFRLINAARPPKQLGLCACISSRITTVIHIVRDFQINYD